MKRTFLFLAAFFSLAVPMLAQDNIPEPTQRTDTPFRIFRTQNIYTLLKLDTRTGQVWQVQWGNESGLNWTQPINKKILVEGVKLVAGRFALCPTANIYSFILLDQEDGRTWRLQWSLKDENRFLEAIPQP